jgi:hypothetical protein
LVVAPISVVQIAGDDDEGDFVFDRLGDEVVKGCASCRANPIGRKSLLSGQPLERAIQVNVSGMKRQVRSVLPVPVGSSMRKRLFRREVAALLRANIPSAITVARSVG